jgi:hypothetical protein
MPEELRFEEAFAESSAVEGHKGPILAIRASVYGAGDDLFSNSRLPCNKDSGPRGSGDPADLLTEPLQAAGGPDEAV